jgi:hypothetical protein
MEKLTLQHVHLVSMAVDPGATAAMMMESRRDELWMSRIIVVLVLIIISLTKSERACKNY